MNGTVYTATNVAFQNTTTVTRTTSSNYDVFTMTHRALAALSCFGIIGNGISISVLRRHNLMETSSLLALVLCVNDVVCCVFRVTSNFARYVELTYEKHHLAYIIVISASNTTSIVLEALLRIIQNISLILTSIIALERLVAVGFPFHVARIFTPGRVKRIIVSVYILYFIIYCPIFMRYSISIRFHRYYQTYVIIAEYSELYRNNMYIIDTYLGNVCDNLVVTICLVIILVSTIWISVKLVSKKFQNIALEESTEKRIKQNRIIKLLTSLCFFAFVMYVNAQIMNYLFLAVEEPLMKDIYYSTYCLLIHANNTGNFVIYIVMSRKFRDHFMRILTWLPRRVFKRGVEYSKTSATLD